MCVCGTKNNNRSGRQMPRQNVHNRPHSRRPTFSPIFHLHVIPSFSISWPKNYKKHLLVVWESVMKLRFYISVPYNIYTLNQFSTMKENKWLVLTIQAHSLPFQFHIQLPQFFCLSKVNINNSTIVFQNSTYYNFRAFAQQFSFNQHFRYVYWSSVSLAPPVLKTKQMPLIPKQIPLVRTNRLISKGIPLVPQQIPLISKHSLGKDPKIFASNSDLHNIKRVG